MELPNTIIETGVDKLVKIINSRGSVSSVDAAKELGVSPTVVMEWADFLEEEGIIGIEYKFTKPFLVTRKLAKKEVQEKAKEFEGKKDVFVRKAEVSLSFLEKVSSKLKTLKDEFEKIKKGLGFDIDKIKDDLIELQKYEQLKIELDKKVEEQKNASINKLQDITNQISMEKKKYDNMLQEIKKEEEILEKDRLEAISIEDAEKLIKKKIDDLRQLIKKVEGKAMEEEESIKNSEQRIQNLEMLAKKTQETVEKERAIIEPLIEESIEQTEKIKRIQDRVVSKILSKEKKLKGFKNASKKLKDFFNKKLGVLSLIEKVNLDRNELEKELIELIKKAKSFQLSSKSADVGAQITDMEKKFKDVDKKKAVFEGEVKELNSFFK
ncbi:MAG: hypothetical protein AABX34_04775 [Nanoarchaeota archaeon]